MPARVLATGLDALAVANGLIESAVDIRHGGYNIRVGTLDRKQKILIVGVVGWEVVYLRDNTLSAYETQQFLRGYMIGEVASEVYQRTAWIIPASKIMVSFITGVTMGYVGIQLALLGTKVTISANVVFVLARVGLAIITHPREVEVVKLHLPQIIRTFAWLNSECPVLSSKLIRLVTRALWEALCDVPSGISAEDKAAMLGRMLGGVTAVSEAAETGLTGLAGVLIRALLIYSTLKIPKFAVHGSVEGADALAKALATELRAQSIALTSEEEAAIAKELAKSAQALSNLQELQTALNAFAPAIDTLVSDLAKGTAE